MGIRAGAPDLTTTKFGRPGLTHNKFWMPDLRDGLIVANRGPRQLADGGKLRSAFAQRANHPPNPVDD